jgi:hypothetical protein
MTRGSWLIRADKTSQDLLILGLGPGIRTGTDDQGDVLSSLGLDKRHVITAGRAPHKSNFRNSGERRPGTGEQMKKIAPSAPELVSDRIVIGTGHPVSPVQ